MDVKYDYSIDDVINYGITDNQSMIDAILKETLPLLPVHMKAPNYGCSAFGTVSDRNILMGRGQPAGHIHGEKARLPDRSVHLSGRHE